MTDSSLQYILTANIQCTILFVMTLVNLTLICTNKLSNKIIRNTSWIILHYAYPICTSFILMSTFNLAAYIIKLNTGALNGDEFPDWVNTWWYVSLVFTLLSVFISICYMWSSNYVNNYGIRYSAYNNNGTSVQLVPEYISSNNEINIYRLITICCIIVNISFCCLIVSLMLFLCDVGSCS